MYCTIEDIKQAIPEDNIIQLTDDTGTGVIDQAKVEDAIQYADQLIDSYLRGRYTVPLNPVPALIRRLSVEMAGFNLYSRRFELAMPEAMLQRRKEIIRLLEQIQKGMITLGTEPPEKGPGFGHYHTNKTAEDRIFNKTVLNGF